jgi:hypothetical protein
MMSNAVRFTKKILNNDFYSYALLLACIFSLGLSGCSGLVTANSTNPPPPALTISGVAAATPTTTGFQVDWATSRAANSAVDYGTTASYGSSTPTNSALVMSHQVALIGLSTGTLYHFRVRSTDAASASASSPDMTFSTAGDTTPPTVSITAPAANATISGVTTVSANATDNVAVASVQFKVDNANTGAAITAAPYNYSLNTTALSNGNHIIAASATDTSGNTATSAGVAIKVNNTSSTVPSITSLNPTSGPVGTSVTITGANFGATQGTSTVTFNGVAATATGWSATSISAAVPSGATTGNVVVTVGGVASNGVNFTVSATAPSITSLNPASGPVGTSVTITGTNFGTTQGTSTVKFNGTAATPTSWNATSITAAVPSGATTGNVVVTVGGVASNGVSFTVPVPTPSITNLNPTTGLVGMSVTITGTNFGTTQGTSTVKFNGTTATPTIWSATSITAAVPNGATTGNVVVTVGGTASNGVSFTVQADTIPPTVPAGLTATAVSSSQINLSWTASTDNVGVTGYNIFRAGVKIGTAPSNSYQDGGLNASTSYSYNVSAFDAAGNTSSQSTAASATTQAASSGGGIPSGLGWYQIPNTSIQSLCPPYSEIQGNSGCKAVMSAWSGGLFDSKRNRLIIHGGGHTDYYGNEIYAIDLNANPIAPVLVKDASHGSGISNVTSCPEAYTDGTPSARHSYNGEVYVANQDTYFTFSGSKSNCGFFSSGAWKYTPSTSAWAQQNTSGSAPNPGQNGSVPTIVYDPTSGNVFEVETNAGVFWKYDPVAVAWTNLANVKACAALNMTAAIDDGRRFYYCIGNGVFSKVSLNAPYTATQLTGSGCSSLVSSAGPGFAYDPVQKLMVGWAGGNTVYLYNPTTDSCSTVTYTGGPTVVQANGTYGRFAYSSALGVFVVANSIDTNAYTLRLTQSGGTGGSGPVISGVSVGSITTIAAIVSWTTDVTATSQVEYGTSTAYGTLTTLDANLLTSHVTPLASLAVNTLYHYRVRSKNSSGVESISGDFVFQTSSIVDTIPPTVSITAPASGATISATTTVSANATDNVGVASVQFTLDGSNLGSALTTSPYQVSWNTTTASNGAHLVSAVARDAAGNVGNATPVSVTVSNSGGSALQDFQTRCATPGVIVCEGFDNASEFTPGVSPFTGVFPGNDGTIEIVQDTSIVASGGGSLHFPIKASDGHAPTVRDDNWVQTFCSAHPPASCSPTVFAQNSTFYVQFRYRVDDGYANTNWEDPVNGASSPKIADFANHTSSCGQTEITTNNRNGSDKPMMYTSCGARGFFVTPGTTNYNPSSPPYSWENGYYNCSYPTVPSGSGGCFTMPANIWMTFYYRVQLGTWSQPNSHITAWVAVDGQPLQTFVDVSDMTINADTPGFDAIYFNVYMTNFAGTATNPAANAWLDEVIVSSAPVPAPAANGGGIPQ